MVTESKKNKADRRRRTRDPVLERWRVEHNYLMEESGRADRSRNWPASKYQSDPVAFGREVLGFPAWGGAGHGQVAILDAVRDHNRVAVRAGRKVSKSHSIAWLALWWFCCWPDAVVIMSSTTANQVDRILWT